MSVFRVTIMFGQAMDGASETYWTTDQPTSVARGNIQQLLRMRADLMNQLQYFQGVRVSIDGQKRSSQLIIPPGAEDFFDSGQKFACPGTGTLPPTGTNGTMDQFRAVLQQKVRFGTNRWTNRYLSGIPDAITETEPVTYTRLAAQQWWKNLDAYRGFLTSGIWQIRCQKLPPDVVAYQVIGVTAQATAPFYLGVILAVGDPAPSIPMGTKVALQGFRPPKGIRASTLNGTWYVDSTVVPTTGELTVYLRGSANIDPSAQRFTDKTTLRPVVYGFGTINYVGTQRVCVHKRGKPSLAPRGRRLSRPSLDP